MEVSIVPINKNKTLILIRYPMEPPVSRFFVISYNSLVRANSQGFSLEYLNTGATQPEINGLGSGRASQSGNGLRS